MINVPRTQKAGAAAAGSCERHIEFGAKSRICSLVMRFSRPNFISAIFTATAASTPHVAGQQSHSRSAPAIPTLLWCRDKKKKEKEAKDGARLFRRSTFQLRAACASRHHGLHGVCFGVPAALHLSALLQRDRKGLLDAAGGIDVVKELAAKVRKHQRDSRRHGRSGRRIPAIHRLASKRGKKRKAGSEREREEGKDGNCALS